MLAILLALFTATMVAQPDILDAEVEFQTTSSLARRGTLALGGTPEADAIIERGYNVHRGGPGREDETFSWYGIGQALVGLPFYLAGDALGRIFPEFERANAETTHMGIGRSEYFAHLFVGWRNPLFAALTAFLLVKTCRRIGSRRSHAWLAGLSYGICTFAWPQARSTLSGVQATFFLFLAFHLTLKIESAFERRRPSGWMLAAVGLALGMAFLTRMLVAPVIVVLYGALVFVLIDGYQRRGTGFRFSDLVWSATPALACFALYLWTNHERFGDPLESGYGDAVQWSDYFNYPLHHGLFRILFAPGQGFLWMAPGVLLLPFWMRRLWRRGKFRTPLIQILVSLAVLIPVSMTAGWHGAWGYGPRYALPMLPFLWIGLAPALDALEELRFGRVLASVPLFFGMLVALGGVLVDHTTHTDLAIQAARLEWPDAPGLTEADQEESRFVSIRLDWRFAAPWAHWRILRHRLAGLGEEFPVRQIFLMDHEAVLRPEHEREKGYQHLTWVDFHRRLGGPTWPATLFCVGILFCGLVLAIRGLDPGLP